MQDMCFCLVYITCTCTFILEVLFILCCVCVPFQRRVSHSDSDKGNFSSSDESSAMHTHLNADFPSPLAKDSSTFNVQQPTFSPSIFLSRPDHTSITSHSLTSDPSESSILPTVSVLSASPVSDEEGMASGETGIKNSFVTSTPIKGNKENLRERWSPTILRKAGSRRHLKDTNEVFLCACVCLCACLCVHMLIESAIFTINFSFFYTDF